MGLDALGLYYKLFFYAPTGYALFDKEYRLHRVNFAFSKLLGITQEELIGTFITDYIYSEDLIKFCREMESITNDNNTTSVKVVLQTSDVKISTNLICNIIEIEGIEYITSTLININSEVDVSNKLEYLSFHDQLTNLYNRRFFEEEIKRLDVKRNLPLTCIMADVNGLKLINDSFGHAVGDELLVKVADAIKAGCREDDIIARVGGDEFIILLPKTDTLTAKTVIDRIGERLREDKIKSLELSVSFGYGTKYDIDEDINRVVKKAEDLMYKRKLFESPSMRSKAINSIISAFYNISRKEEIHSKNVGYLASEFARAIGCHDYQIKEMETIGRLHDIGKIGIDNDIFKKSKVELTESDWEEIKRHPEIGYQIIGSLHEMADMAKVILSHHERWDGTGYPKGLRGTEIPRRARILAICDCYDFMLREVSYGSNHNEEYAISEIISNAGTQFDPDLAKIFIEEVLRKDYSIYNELLEQRIVNN